MRTDHLVLLLLTACTAPNPIRSGDEDVDVADVADVADAVDLDDVADLGPTSDASLQPQSPVADSDRDGVPDDVDNCPHEDNPDQANLDKDGNGGDACDPCPARGGDAASHADVDRDGAPFCARDCDDEDPTVGPYAEEICDGRDNDCDFQVDEDEQGDVLRRQCYEWEVDLSALGVCQRGRETCVGGEWSECVGAVYPEPETLDGLDNDCDGETDEPE